MSNENGLQGNSTSVSQCTMWVSYTLPNVNDIELSIQSYPKYYNQNTFKQLLTMSTLFNSQQNININISYHIPHHPLLTRKIHTNQSNHKYHSHIHQQPSQLNHPTTKTQHHHQHHFKYNLNTNPKTKSKTQSKKYQHLKSCILQPNKKLQIHSQNLSSNNPPHKKKRLPSATINKKNKIVNKLLNISVLASDIAPTQSLISSSSSNQHTLNRLFRQYLSTLDMKLVDDIKKHRKQINAKSSNLLQTLHHRGYTLEQLNKSATIIQKAWRKQLKTQVVNFYGNLFENVIQSKFDVRKEPQIKPLFIHTQKHRNNKSTSQILQKQQPQKLLNIAKYKQLVNIHKNKKDKKIINEKFKQQQMEHWNNINKLISCNMKNQGIIDSQKLLNQLIKQSTLNKQWIEDDNQSSLVDGSQNVSSQQIQREISKNRLIINQKSEQKISNCQKQQQIVLNQDIQELDDQKEYNWNKYTLNKERQSQWDTDWIKKQLKGHGIMRDFVDCGLDGFGVKILDKPHFNSCEDQALDNLKKNSEQFQEKGKQNQQEQKKEQILNFVIQSIIEELAEGYILKRASKKTINSNIQEQQVTKKGIQASFNAVKDYLTKLKNFIINNKNHCDRIIVNLNRQIGPSSIEVLSYLRVTDQGEQFQNDYDIYDDLDQDSDHLHVVPIDIFHQFENQLFFETISSKQQTQSNELTNLNGDKIKFYKTFFHQSIFQSFNEFLDYEKPFGIKGRPYQWSTQPRIRHTCTYDMMQNKLSNAINHVLQTASFVSGIIFQKQDSPFSNVYLLQEHKIQINEERLSRILANQLFDAEYQWINYEDQKVQLLVELSQLIQKHVMSQIKVQILKIIRYRTLLCNLID